LYRSKISSISRVILFMLLTFLLVAPSLASPERTVGVQEGDWADYVVTYEGNSTEMMGGDLVNVTGMRVTVVSVSGTNVTLESTTDYENGSDTVDTGWIDVETGEQGGNFTFAGVLIAANLNQGDPVYTVSQSFFGEGTINETVTRGYLGSMVEVNHFILNMTIPPNPVINLTYSWSWYWYRATGLPAEMTFYYMQESAGFIPVETSVESVPIAQSSNMTWFEIHLTIVDVIPEFPSTLILPLLMIIALVAVMLRKKGRMIETP